MNLSQSTRNEAFYAHRDSGAMGDQERAVMHVFHAVGNEGKDFTLGELAAILSLPTSTVSARVNALKKTGFLVESTPRHHKFSHVRVTPLKLPAKQGSLFQ